ncbi:MAG: hypothetical protein BWY79_00630 [Actinobacteria bacterium ADurb.Bin444]|nr:MAG: hypothetical protein BWY79_00630 [Actinobacteria bacterium ADurb.Bin444]
MRVAVNETRDHPLSRGVNGAEALSASAASKWLCHLRGANEGDDTVSDADHRIGYLAFDGSHSGIPDQRIHHRSTPSGKASQFQVSTFFRSLNYTLGWSSGALARGRVGEERSPSSRCHRAMIGWRYVIRGPAKRMTARTR